MPAPRLLVIALAALAGGERLPKPPSCVHSCNPTAHIYPDSGNKRRIWPECPSADGDCRSTCADRLPDCARYAAAYDGHGFHAGTSQLKMLARPSASPRAHAHRAAPMRIERHPCA